MRSPTARGHLPNSYKSILMNKNITRFSGVILWTLSISAFSSLSEISTSMSQVIIMASSEGVALPNESGFPRSHCDHAFLFQTRTEPKFQQTPNNVKYNPEKVSTS